MYVMIRRRSRGSVGGGERRGRAPSGPGSVARWPVMVVRGRCGNIFCSLGGGVFSMGWGSGMGSFWVRSEGNPGPRGGRPSFRIDRELSAGMFTNCLD